MHVCFIVLYRVAVDVFNAKLSLATTIHTLKETRTHTLLTHTAGGMSSYYFCVISLVSRMHGGIGCLLMQRAS